MKTVYKYELLANEVTSVLELPENAIIRKVAALGDGIFIWAEVDTESPKKRRYIEVFETGQEIPQEIGLDRVYIDTALLGGLVFHVYERR